MLWPFRGKICHPLARQWSDSSSSAAPPRWILQARGVRSYQQVWHLSSQKRKAQSCQNSLPLGSEKELIPTSWQGVPGSEPREWISSSSHPVFTDRSMPAVHQLRPALLVALCSFSGQAVLWWPQPMSCTAHPDASGRALKVHLRSNVKPVYRVHNLSVGNAKKHSQSRIKPHDDNNKSPVALFCQKQFKEQSSCLTPPVPFCSSTELVSQVPVPV